MKIKLTTKEINNEQFIKRAFWLLYQACGGTAGLGVLQANPDATEDDVFQNVGSMGDYPGNHLEDNEFYGDYVFGKMMKWGIKLDKGIISTKGMSEFQPDYQGFASTYPNNKAIMDAVMESFDIKSGYKVIE